MTPRAKALWWILAVLLDGVAIWRAAGQAAPTNETKLVAITTEVTNEYRSIGVLTLHSGSNLMVLIPFATTNVRLAGTDIILRSSQGRPASNWCDVLLEPLPIHPAPTK